MKKHRIYYLDMLRIIATLAVIIIHVSSQSLFYLKNVHTFIWQSLNFWDSMSRWSVPVFVMISGALFLDPSRLIKIKTLFTKNIWRIVCATIFWHIFYALYTFIFESHSLSVAIKLIIRGYSHLWFLHMIIGLYLLVPLLRKITENTRLTRYFLILAAIFSIIIPTFFGVYRSIVHYQIIPAIVKSIMRSLINLNNSFYFSFTLYFSTYFVAGYYLNHIEINKVWQLIIYLLAILGFVVTFVGTNYLSLRFNKRILPFYDYMSLNVALSSVGVFAFFKELSKKINWNKNSKAVTCMTALSTLTFGIYLIHFLFVRVGARNFHMFKLMPNTFLAVPIISVIIFIISAIIAYIIHQIPWFRNHIM